MHKIVSGVGSTLQLEVSHPRATAILNQIMAALGNIGS